MNKELKFCLVGRGSIGTRHLENLLSLSYKNVIAYSERSDDPKDREFLEKFGMKTFHDVTALEEFAPDAFIIANPTADHMNIARVAVAMNSHIFMEKPLSNDLSGVEELKKEVKKRNLVFALANNFRYHPVFKKIKEMVEEKAFGNLWFTRIMAGQYLPDWHPWEDYRQSYSARKKLGGGVVLTMQHEIDYAYWLFGRFKDIQSCIKKVSALEMDVEDIAAIIVEAESGQLIEIHVDYLQRPPARTIQIQGDKGSINYRLGEPDLMFYDFEQKSYDTVLHLGAYDNNQMYIDELNHFIECVRDREEPASGIDDAVYVLNACLKVKEGFVS